MKNFNISTTYNKISAEYHENRLELRSGNNALQSVIDLDRPSRLVMKNLCYLIAVLLFIPPPRRILMLGTAAGSLLHFLRQHYPKCEITALDIDLEMIEEFKSRGLLPAADARLSYVFDDASHYIEHCQQRYDLILVDIFDGNQSPDWLLQKPVNHRLNQLLEDQGAIACNLLIESEHLFNRYYRDIRLIYKQQTLCVAVEGLENTIVYGLKQKPEGQDMNSYMELALQRSQAEEIDYMEILAAIYTTNPQGSGVI